MIWLITGGARSGKSAHAMKLAKELSGNPVYVATARRWDKEFQGRIDRHKTDRGNEWTTIEEEKRLGNLNLSNKVVVVDCVTLWITNFFADLKGDVEACLRECKSEIDNLDKQDTTWIIITNEIGMGVHAETEAGRKFTDLHGWMNQYIAERAAKVIFMVSGVPVVIKGEARK